MGSFVTAKDPKAPMVMMTVGDGKIQFNKKASRLLAILPSITARST